MGLILSTIVQEVVKILPLHQLILHKRPQQYPIKMKEFEGKTAVITGAASGIGKALAERFAKEKMQVVLADIEEEALEKTSRKS